MTIDISGRVIHGEHFGKKLGFPTANLDRREYIRRKLKVRFGIWAGTGEIPNSKFQIPNKFQRPKSKIFKAGIVIGPLDKYHLPKIEAHLIGFKGNLYGKRIGITLRKYIRPFKKYKNVADLKKQIAKDIGIIKQSEF